MLSRRVMPSLVEPGVSPVNGPPPLDDARGGHTPFMTIDSDVVQRLVDADDDAVLALLEGRALIIGASQLDDDSHRGAFQVISRTDFLRRVGDAAGLSDDEVGRQAAILNAEVSELGG